MSKSILNEEKALKKAMAGAIILAVRGIVLASVSGSCVIFLDGSIQLKNGDD